MARPTCGRRPRAPWSVRSPTGSRSRRCSATRSGCASRTRRSSRTARTRSAPRSAPSSRTSSSPTRWSSASCASIGIAARLGEWLSRPANADRLTAEASVAARGVMTLLGDDDVEDVIEKLARRHLFEPEWGPAIGRMGERLVAANQQRAAVDALLREGRGVARGPPRGHRRHRLRPACPGGCPTSSSGSSTSGRTRRCSAFVRAVREDPAHPMRETIDRYLADLANDLQHDPLMIGRLEQLKVDLLESPRVREFAGEVWTSVKDTLDDVARRPRQRAAPGVPVGGRRGRASGSRPTPSWRRRSTSG